jgi:lipopolysaccharide transport system permease protein
MSIPEKAGLLEPGLENASASPVENPSSSNALPDKPLIKVRPDETWKPIDLGELWAHHELFYFLIWRDLKVRYKQTILGSAWVILQPLLMTLVFTIFLGRLIQFPTAGVPYYAFAYAGLLAWTFFSNAVLSSSHSLVSSAHLITKVYFPRTLIPGAVVAVRLVDFGIAFITLLIMLLHRGITPTWNMLLFPVFVLQLALLALGIGLWTAALNVKYRDVGTVLPVLLQLWMFISPVVYPSAIVRDNWRWIYDLNPMSGIIEGMRASLFNLKFDWMSVGISAGVTLLIILYATYSFRRAEESFADVV